MVVAGIVVFLAHHNCFQVKNLKFLPPILLGHVFLKVGGYGSPMVPKQLIPGVICTEMVGYG
jgi:hypothetical protein